MKKYTAIISLILVLCLLTGCAGSTVVYYSDCTCPAGSHVQETPTTEAPHTEAPVVTEDAVKTGLAIITTAGFDITKSAWHYDYYAVIVGVLVDTNGVIQDCIIDCLNASLPYDTNGDTIDDLTAPMMTLGDMSTTQEWRERIAALADFAVGKTVEELCSGAVDEAGKVTGADMSYLAARYLDNYLNAIEKAVSNARNLGAQTGDQLRLAVQASFADSSENILEDDGAVQLNLDAVVISMNGHVITSCVLDAVQAKVSYEETDVGDIPKDFPTKNELGEAYGMKAWGGAKYEWNEQAANFAAYVTGKTAAEVAGIAIAESTKPAEGTDLAASVTIAIGGFQALIAKAAK